MDCQTGSHHVAPNDVKRVKASPNTRILKMKPLVLDGIPTALHPQAIKAFQEGDAHCFLGMGGNVNGLWVVYDNWQQLRERGIYEGALLSAFSLTKGNNVSWPITNLEFLFNLADRQKLLDAGDTLPDGESFTLYRGVAGKQHQRKVRSFSWTLDLPVACWFAMRFPHFDAPGVYKATVNRTEILAYDNGRNEREVICRPKSCSKYDITTEQMKDLASKHTARKP